MNVRSAAYSVKRGAVWRLSPMQPELWQHGKPQRDWRKGLWWGVAFSVLILVWFVGGGLWLLRDGVVSAAQLQTAWSQLRLKPEIGMALAALALNPFVLWAMRTRELHVSADGLRLRYAWAWLDHWLGWRVPLRDLQRGGVQLRPGLGHDPLLALHVMLPVARWPWLPARRLRLSEWGPAADGRPPLGEWPAPKAPPPSRMSVFLMRPPELDAAQRADLGARAARLPLGQALLAHGVDVAAWPAAVADGAATGRARGR